MEPPKHICAALYRKNPLLRLAWWGNAPKEEGELNPGCFALLKLVPIKYVGRYEDPKVMSEFWDASLIMNSGGGFEVVRTERGPVFSRHGTTKPDWVQSDFAPVIIHLFNESFGHSHADVFTGRFMYNMRTDSVDAVKREEAKAAAEHGRALRDACHEMSKDLIADARQHNDYTNNMARKHILQTNDPHKVKPRDIVASTLKRRGLDKYI